MCQNPICAGSLIPSCAFDKPAMAIQLQTPQNVFRPGYAAKVGRVALVTHVNIASASGATHTTLTTCTFAARCFGAASNATLWRGTVRVEDSPCAKGRARLRGVRRRLGLDLGIVNGISLNHLVYQGEEVGVLGEGLESWRVDRAEPEGK